MHMEVLIWTDRNRTQWTNLRWLHDTHPGQGLWCFAAGAPREISLPLSTHMLWVWCNFEGYKYFLLDWPCDHMLFTNISLNTFLCSHGTYQQLIKHVNTSKDIFLLSNSDVEFCSTGSTTYHWQMSLMEFALMCPLLDSSFIDLQNAT